jgi:ABC-type spermidine/putrescine transport system permease subunit I
VHESYARPIKAAQPGYGWRLIRTPAVPVLVWPALAYLAAFYLVPLLQVLQLSIFDGGVTLAHFERLVGVSIYRTILVNTFEIALIVSGACLLLAYPTAYLLVTSPPRRAGLLLVFVLVPFFTSLLVRNYAWIFLLGARGVVNTALVQLGLVSQPLPLMFNRFGVVVGMVHVLLPYAILVLLAVMRGIDPQLLRAASSLGAGPFTTFRRVFLPLSIPGIGASFVLVFVLSLAFFVTPAMLGSARETMIANVIASQMTLLQLNFAAALAVMLLLVSLGAILLLQWSLGGAGLLVAGEASHRPVAHESKVREGRVTWLLDSAFNPVWPHLPIVVGAMVLVYLFVPVLVVVPLSFNPQAFFVFPPTGLSLRWYEAYLTNRDWLDATRNSFVIGGLTAALTMLIAIPAAIGLSRSRSRLGPLIYAFMLSPLIVPSIIIAVAVFLMFTNLGLTGTVWGVAMGHTIGALPLAIVVLLAALRNFDRNLERAALSLGASPFWTALRVTLPVLKTAVFTAAFFSFLHSFDELLIALFVSRISARTLPKKMWESLQEINPTIAAVSTLLVVFTIVALLTLNLAQRSGSRREQAAR